MTNLRPLFLVVEDNADDEAMTMRALRKEVPGARFTVARDGAEAIGCLSGRLSVDGVAMGEFPDVVLLDLKLPRFSGLEVLRRLRECESTRNTPVVLFSSSDEETDVQSCYAAGANTYIKKPVDFEAYLEAVRQAARYWTSLARLPQKARPAATDPC